MTAILSRDLIAEADKYLDDGSNYDRFKTLGEKLYEVFQSEGNDRVSTQVRNLQQITVTAARFGDIEDFVKNQMGKDSKQGKWREVGDSVLQQLQKLRDTAKEIAGDDTSQLGVRLHLARGWVRTVVGEYMYAKAQTGEGRTS